MRKILATGLLLLASAEVANATNCVSWRKISAEGKRERVAGMISSHMSSHVTRRYTSENRVAMQGCLRQFADQIGEEFDAFCAERPGGSAEMLDDIFDRYLLSCVQ